MNACNSMSLRNQSLMKIASNVWSSQLKNTDKSMVLLDIFDWLIMVNSCRAVINKLILPDLFKEKLNILVRYMGIENAIHYYRLSTILMNVRFLHSGASKFCWTFEGKLDIKKIVKKMLADQSFSLSDRYKLACMTCFEDEIREFWIQLPDDEREIHLQRNTLSLVNIWSYTLSGREMGYPDTINDYNSFISFYCSFVKNENLTEAMGHYWANIIPGKRDAALGLLEESFHLMCEEINLVFKQLESINDILYFVTDCLRFFTCIQHTHLYDNAWFISQRDKLNDLNHSLVLNDHILEFVIDLVKFMILTRYTIVIEHRGTQAFNRVLTQKLRGMDTQFYEMRKFCFS